MLKNGQSTFTFRKANVRNRDNSESTLQQEIAERVQRTDPNLEPERAFWLLEETVDSRRIKFLEWVAALCLAFCVFSQAVVA